MAQPEEARDPSMEEILASIRRIIAEDGSDPDGQPHLSVVSDPEDDTSAGDATKAAEPIDDDLSTDESDVDTASTGPGSADEDDQVKPESTDSTGPLSMDVTSTDVSSIEDPDLAADPDSGGPEAEPTDELASGENESDQTNSRLLSPRADHAVHGAFDQLASTILSDQTRTLEDLVRDMMRPMLQHWLDDNLPVLVERLVREEIERVSRGRR